MTAYLSGYGLGAAQRINQQRVWHYFGTTMPTGVGAADAVYRGDTLTDQSANANHLTLGAGVTRRTVEGRNSLVGLDIDIADNYKSTAALNSITALTLEMIWRPTGLHTVTQNLYFHEGTGGVGEANNLTYWMFVASAVNRLSLGTEHGVGVQETHATALALPTGATTHLVHTRASDGITDKLYMNGRLMETITFTDAPTGGGSGVLNFGSTARFVLFGARIKLGTAYTADQVAESYQSVYYAD